MKTAKATVAYLLALAAIPLVLVTFVGLHKWASVLMDGTGLVLSPRFTGGAVVSKIDHGTYTTSIHEPVFERLFGHSRNGFVQVDWGRKAAVPVSIDEEIDFDADGTPDFRIQWDRPSGKLLLKPLRREVVELGGHYELAERYSVRVRLTSLK
jgi:hypothetical protein